MVRLLGLLAVVLLLPPLSGRSVADRSVPQVRAARLSASTVHCLDAAVGGWRLVASSCASRTAHNVTVSPPPAVQGSIILPSLQLQANGEPVLPIHLPDAALTVIGLQITGSGLSLQTSGLTITRAAVALPQQLNAAGGALSAVRLTLDGRGRLTGGQIRTTDAVQLIWSGAQVRVSGFSIADGAVVGQGVTANLPPVFHASAGLRVNTLRLGGPDLLAGAIDGLSFQLGDLRVRADRVRFVPHGLAVDQIHLSLSDLNTTIVIPGFIYTEQTGIIPVGGAAQSIPLRPIPLQGASLSATVKLSLAQENNAISYHFRGSGSVALPYVVVMDAHVEIGPVDAIHPGHLYHASVNWSGRPGIPLGTTGLRLVGIQGDVQPSRVRPVTYAFKFTAQIQTLDDGLLFHGTMSGSVLSDGNAALTGTGQILYLISGRGSLCLRLVARNDGACAAALQGPTASTSGTGAFFQLSGRTALHIGGTATLNLKASGHLWYDQVLRVYGTVDVNGTVRAGFIADGVPPCGASADGNGLLARFHHHGAPIFGIKVQLHLHPCVGGFDRGVFIDQHGNVDLDNRDYIPDRV